MMLAIATAFLLGMISLLAYRLLVDRSIPAPPISESRTFTGFETLEELTRKTVWTDEHQVRAVIENLATGTSFSLSQDAKNRLLRAELLFREGRHAGLTTTKIVIGLNDFVHRLDLPLYMLATEDEVATLKNSGRALVPHVFTVDNQRSDQVLSPVGGAWIALIAIQQRLARPLGSTAGEPLAQKISGSNKPDKRYVLQVRQLTMAEMTMCEKVQASFRSQGTVDLIGSIGL